MTILHYEFPHDVDILWYSNLFRATFFTFVREHRPPTNKLTKLGLLRNLTAAHRSRMLHKETALSETRGQTDEDMHHALWPCPLYDAVRNETSRNIEVMDAAPIHYADPVSVRANIQFWDMHGSEESED
ncbi:hypothetical protein EVAR_16868_1 [Eumeta japonica]|uniref:Uncharacterized protein n=1 Tax=Eumeta variegata TaxID=151549 RepID=A0A4C1V3T7_EUMVA|nr:hypothetical protein EVAR_16868_1 [Eumeta japonica]